MERVSVLGIPQAAAVCLASPAAAHCQQQAQHQEATWERKLSSCNISILVALLVRGACASGSRSAGRTSFSDTMKGCFRLLWCTISRLTYVLKFLTCSAGQRPRQRLLTCLRVTMLCMHVQERLWANHSIFQAPCSNPAEPEGRRLTKSPRGSSLMAISPPLACGSRARTTTPNVPSPSTPVCFAT